MHPYMMTIDALEATLYVLYSTEPVNERTYECRADLARAYHERTGRWFAARFYC
jgi:hypothetical protein